MEKSTTEPMNGTDTRVCHASGDTCHGCPHYWGKADVCSEYTPPDPIASLLDLCWVQAANFSHCQTERDRRVAFRAVVEERLRGIPGVASLILDDLEASR